jgi:hypothetical protein
MNLPGACAAHREALQCLVERGPEFAVGGAFSMAWLTGARPPTKDLDIFLRPRDLDATLSALEAAGFRTEVTLDHWLAKARKEGSVTDLIFGSANGLCRVDDAFMRRTRRGLLFDLEVDLVGAEDMIFSKAFVMDRERYDGADVQHLILAAGPNMDWSYLLDRFGSQWPVLLSHVVLFDFVFPSERSAIPERVRRTLFARAEDELGRDAPAVRLCRGPLLARRAYLQDIDAGFFDARKSPVGNLTDEQIDRWTRHEDPEEEKKRKADPYGLVFAGVE